MKLDEVDAVIAARVAARTAAAASGLEAAMQPARRGSAFWKTRPAAASAPTAASTAAPVTATEASLPLQSKAVGGNVVVLWNGRPLDVAEQAKLAELSAPLVAFLLSTSTPPAKRVRSAAAGESQPEVKPTRSPKEPRR
jgi:hypothetical protein